MKVSEEAINPRSSIDIRTVEEQAIEDGTDVIAITSYDDESSGMYFLNKIEQWGI